MNAVDRCACIPHYQDAGAGLTEYVPEWDPSCSEHGEVDHILASGRYTDRRGRGWIYDTKHRFWLANPDFVAGWKVSDFGGPLDETQMRLLIEREQHREVCPSLPDCTTHPVPIVIVGYDDLEWRDFKVRAHGRATMHRTLSEAMDVARALAVEP